MATSTFIFFSFTFFRLGLFGAFARRGRAAHLLSRAHGEEQAAGVASQAGARRRSRGSRRSGSERGESQGKGKDCRGLSCLRESSFFCLAVAALCLLLLLLLFLLFIRRVLETRSRKEQLLKFFCLTFLSLLRPRPLLFKKKKNFPPSPLPGHQRQRRHAGLGRAALPRGDQRRGVVRLRPGDRGQVVKRKREKRQFWKEKKRKGQTINKQIRRAKEREREGWRGSARARSFALSLSPCLSGMSQRANVRERRRLEETFLTL